MAGDIREKELLALVDDSIKGLLRSIGDAGDSPTNQTGHTVLKTLDVINQAVKTRTSGGENYSSSTGASLSVTINFGYDKGRAILEVWVKSSAAADFTVEASRNGTDWRTVETISLGAAGEDLRTYRNAYQYIKVSTGAANDNEIEIVGAA